MTLKIQQKKDLVHYVSSQNACQPNATYGELTRNLWHYMLGAKIAQPFYLEKPEDYNIDNQLTQIVIDGELVNMYYEAEKTILFNFAMGAFDASSDSQIMDLIHQYLDVEPEVHLEEW